MTRALLALLCGFAALSSGVADAIGFQAERVVLFSGLAGLLFAWPYLRGAPAPRPGGAVVCLLLLLLAVALGDALSGQLDPLDYKVALPLLALAAGPSLARDFDGPAVADLVWRLLGAYVLATFAYQLLAEPAAVSRGYAGITRYDPTGSVIMHASLCLVCLTQAAVRVAGGGGLVRRLPALAIGGMALVMVLGAATRTVLVTLALLACFHVATAARRGAALRQLAAAGLVAVPLCAAYSAFWNPSFLLRLLGAEVEDYGSGRLPSIAYWLGLAGDHPFGLGFGAVRELMADGKPYLDGDATLEWPHNELVRFYVEAGPVGLGLVLLLMGTIVRLALRAAAVDPLPARRLLALGVAADLVAECCLQNLFNAIYHATVLVTFLTLAAHTALREATGASAVPQEADPGQAAGPGPTFPPLRGRAGSGQEDDGGGGGNEHLRPGIA